MNDLTTKSLFCVFNNPEEHGYSGTPQEIIDRLREEWIASSPTRTGAWYKKLLIISFCPDSLLICPPKLSRLTGILYLPL